MSDKKIRKLSAKKNLRTIAKTYGENLTKIPQTKRKFQEKTDIFSPKKSWFEASNGKIFYPKIYRTKFILGSREYLACNQYLFSPLNKLKKKHPKPNFQCLNFFNEKFNDIFWRNISFLSLCGIVGQRRRGKLFFWKLFEDLKEKKMEILQPVRFLIVRIYIV